ncbi:MAG: hypothetical protein PHC34_07335 [Candidatus Gastranaerophilales bacterium]|nr:hypothetical protein [Candidatus Gastranaerophilales bacterium]
MTNIGMNPYTGLPYNQGNFNGVTTPGAISVNDQIKDSPAGNAASDFPTTPDEFIKAAPYYAVGAGGGFAIMKGINAVCNKDGAYEGSKLAEWAGKIDGNKYINSTNGKVESWITNRINGLKKWHSELPVNSSRKKIIDSINQGTTPGNSMAKSQIHGISGMAADHVKNELVNLKESGKLEKALNELKIDSKEIEKIKGILDNKNLPGLKAIEQIEESLGGPKGLTALGDKFKDIKTPRTLKIPFVKEPLSLGNKTLNLNLSLNKLKGLQGAETKTFVSRILQKSGLIAGEAASGTIIGGGAFGLVLSAFFIGGSIKKAMEAPKGERLSTFMEEFIGNYFGFFVTMPFAMKALYSTAGLKNLGMDKKIGESLDGFKKAGNITTKFTDGTTIKQGIKELEERIAKETGEAAIKTRNEIKALKSLSGKGLPFVQKVSKFFGRVLGVGLEKLPAVTKTQKVLGKMKGFGGGGMRFAVIMFAIAPVLTKPFFWLSHAIFGTPTATKEAEKAKETEQAANDNTQPVVNNNTQTSPFTVQNQNVAPVNTVNNSQEPVRTYIPSAEPAVFQAQQNQALTNVLNKSDVMMNYANGVLQNSH